MKDNDIAGLKAKKLQIGYVEMLKEELDQHVHLEALPYLDDPL